MSETSATGRGGAIKNSDGLGGPAATLTATNSTIVLNVADSDRNGAGSGGGIFTGPSQSTTLYNTIVAGNVRPLFPLFTAPFRPNDLAGDAVQAASAFDLIGDACSSGRRIN